MRSSIRSVLPFLLQAAITGNWPRIPGITVNGEYFDTLPRIREEPQWVQDAKIAAAGEKRMMRRMRPQGSSS